MRILLGLVLAAPAVAQCPSWSPDFAFGLQGLDGAVECFALLDTGSGPRLHACGDFSAGVVRWNGAAWESVGTAVGGPSSEGTALAAVSGGGAGGTYVCGWISSAADMVAVWNGSDWGPLASPRAPLLDGGSGVYSLASFDGGGGAALYAGGVFEPPSGSGGPPLNSIAAWDGASWLPVGGGLLPAGHHSGCGVLAFAVYDDGQGPSLFAAGRFATAGGTTLANIARWDGGAWWPVGGGLGQAPLAGFDFVRALAVYDDGNGPALFAGGSFSTAGGVSVSNIARWDGNAWTALGAGVLGSVSALAPIHDGLLGHDRLAVAGAFTSAGGTPAENLAFWDGSSWTGVVPGIPNTSGNPGYVYALSGEAGAGVPDLWVGGYFTSAGGLPSSNVARWTGCLSESFCSGDGSLPTPCPCGNYGLPGHGCANSVPGSAGASTSASGTTEPDTLVLTCAGTLPSSLSIFLQTSSSNPAGVTFGDGVHCIAGNLKRIGVKQAGGGIASYPGPGDLSISARSAQLGDPLGPYTQRNYQVYYRDPAAGFCTAQTYNISNALRIGW
jgi:hypothetical protein